MGKKEGNDRGDLRLEFSSEKQRALLSIRRDTHCQKRGWDIAEWSQETCIVL
jgi:hypothetical protein